MTIHTVKIREAPAPAKITEGYKLVELSHSRPVVRSVNNRRRSFCCRKMFRILIRKYLKIFFTPFKKNVENSERFLIFLILY